MVARKLLTSDDLAARKKDDDEEFFNQILIEGARAIAGIRDDVPIEPMPKKGAIRVDQMVPSVAKRHSTLRGRN